MGIYNPAPISGQNNVTEIITIGVGNTIVKPVTTTKQIMLPDNLYRGKIIIWNHGTEEVVIYFGERTDAAMRLSPNGYFIDEFPATIDGISAKVMANTGNLTITEFNRFLLNASSL